MSSAANDNLRDNLNCCKDAIQILAERETALESAPLVMHAVRELSLALSTTTDHLLNLDGEEDHSDLSDYLHQIADRISRSGKKQKTEEVE
jgi:hypothetical protein